MPLFVRAGSIVPIGPKIQFADEQPDAPIELWVYPGQDVRFTLYQDEGDNYNYERGNFALIQMVWDDNARQLILENRQGSFLGMQTSKTFRVVLANEKIFDPLRGEMADARMIHYDGSQIVLEF